MKTFPTSVRFDEDTDGALDMASDEFGVSRALLIQAAVRKMLKELATQEEIVIARQSVRTSGLAALFRARKDRIQNLAESLNASEVRLMTPTDSMTAREDAQAHAPHTPSANRPATVRATPGESRAPNKAHKSQRARK